MIEYQIVRAAAETGQIDVLYKNDGNVLGIYAIDVPIVDGAFLTGDTLHSEIMHRAPVWVAQRGQEVAAATGFADILALVQPLPQPEVTPEEQANLDMWSSVDFESKLAKVLVKFGVLQSDPTTVQTTKL